MLIPFVLFRGFLKVDSSYGVTPFLLQILFRVDYCAVYDYISFPPSRCLLSDVIISPLNVLPLCMCLDGF